MVTENIVTNLKTFLIAISYIIIGVCLQKLIFNYKEVEKSEHVIVLALIASLSLTAITLDDLSTRILFGYLILFGTVYVLAKEMRQKNKGSK